MAVGELARQTDPFAATGGGVQLPNGQWVPRNHPLAQQFLASQGGAGTPPPLAQQIAPPPVAVAAPNPNDPFAAIGGGFAAPGPVVGGTPNQPPSDPYLEAASRNYGGGAIEQPEAAPGFSDRAQNVGAVQDYAKPAASANFYNPTTNPGGTNINENRSPMQGGSWGSPGPVGAPTGQPLNDGGAPLQGATLGSLASPVRSRGYAKKPRTLGNRFGNAMNAAPWDGAAKAWG